MRFFHFCRGKGKVMRRSASACVVRCPCSSESPRLLFPDTARPPRIRARLSSCRASARTWRFAPLPCLFPRLPSAKSTPAGLSASPGRIFLAPAASVRLPRGVSPVLPHCPPPRCFRFSVPSRASRRNSAPQFPVRFPVFLTESGVFLAVTFASCPCLPPVASVPRVRGTSYALPFPFCGCAAHPTPCRSRFPPRIFWCIRHKSSAVPLRGGFSAPPFWGFPCFYGFSSAMPQKMHHAHIEERFLRKIQGSFTTILENSMVFHRNPWDFHIQLWFSTWFSTIMAS